MHVWTLTSGFRLATGHLVLEAGTDLGSVLERATETLRHDFSVEHATLQCEPDGFQESVREL